MQCNGKNRLFLKARERKHERKTSTKHSAFYVMQENLKKQIV